MGSYSFDLIDLDSKSIDKSELKKDVILYFWATWCSECKGKIKSNFKEIDKKRYSILLVNMDENPKRAKKFVDKYSKGKKVFRDYKKTYEKLFKISALPYWAHYQNKDNMWILIKDKVGALHL